MPATIALKRLVLAVVGLLGAGFGTLIVLSLLVPADAVREAVKAQMHEMTGLDPVLSGEVTVSLFPSGSVRFKDVSLGDRRADNAALSADELVVRLSFFRFLLGDIEIVDVTLVRPTIAIAFAQDGASNWSGNIETLARALQPRPGRKPSFSEIRIADGSVLLHDEAFTNVETLSKVEFSLAWPSISKSFAATGRFEWHDQPLNATLSLTDFLAALRGERSGLKLRINSTPLKFAFDGNISHRPSLRIEGQLAADSTSLRDTLRWAGWPVPEGGFGRFAVKAQSNVVGANISLTGVNIELDGNAGEGVLTYANDGRQTLQGTLATEALDLTPYISTVRLLTGSDRSWNRMPLRLDGLGGLDADLRLSAARVSAAAVKFGRTAAAINLRGGNLTIAVGESQAFGGLVRGSFGLANTLTGADLKAQLQFSDVDLDQTLAELIGVRRIEGKGDIGFAVESSGASIYELTQGLNGSATVAGRRGAITGINLEQLLKRLDRNPLAGRGDLRAGKTPYELLAVNLKITRGTAQFEEVRVEGPSVRLELTGAASIPARELDLRGVASLLPAAPREGGGFELPFLVQGPWEDPAIWPDARALINRSGAAAPLMDAVRSRLLPAPVRPAPAEAPTGVPMPPGQLLPPAD